MHSSGRETTCHISAGEWILVVVIVAVGAWLRVSHLDLLEFGSDQVVAAQLALRFVQEGVLPQAGLMSSVGVMNPPLFIYLVIPMFALTQNVALVSVMIGLLSLGAVVACWHVGRTYYGKTAGLVAAALFAVSPWAVIYSRAVWAQDFVPLLTTAAVWAVHALVLGKRPRAVLWVVFLPLWVIQIHFSGLAFTAGILAILLVLRPRMDWRYAIAGVMVAVVPLIPYLLYQTKTNWTDFKRASQTVGGQSWEAAGGLTIQPTGGFLIPTRQYWRQGVAIMNGGQIEDRLGLSADRQFDKLGVYAVKRPSRHPFFSETLTLGESVLSIQRLIFVAGWVALVVVAVRSLRGVKRWPFINVGEEGMGQRAWILVLWTGVPLLAYWAVGLWTYLSYFVILYPAHYLVLGWLAHWGEAKAKSAGARVAIYIVVAVVAVWNVSYLLDVYRFVEKLGGAHGTYCTALVHKRAAARWIAARANAEELMQKGRLLQLMESPDFRRPRLAEIELPWLAMVEQVPPAPDRLPTNAVVLVVDENRANFTAAEWNQLAAAPQTNFGPLRLVLLTR